jgi:hypothetical protein
MKSIAKMLPWQVNMRDKYVAVRLVNKPMMAWLARYYLRDMGKVADPRIALVTAICVGEGGGTPLTTRPA